MNAIKISLQPIKVRMERLGRSNATLVKAEGALILTLDGPISINKSSLTFQQNWVLLFVMSNRSSRKPWQLKKSHKRN